MLTRRDAILGMLAAGAAFMCRGPLALALPEGEVVSYESGEFGSHYDKLLYDDVADSGALTEDEFTIAVDTAFEPQSDALWLCHHPGEVIELTDKGILIRGRNG